MQPDQTPSMRRIHVRRRNWEKRAFAHKAADLSTFVTGGVFVLLLICCTFEHALGGRECSKLMNADRLFCCCKAGRFGGTVRSDFFCTCMYVGFGDRRGGSFGHACRRRMVPSNNPNSFTHTPHVAPISAQPNPHHAWYRETQQVTALARDPVNQR
jgi:hypothetical protein